MNESKEKFEMKAAAYNVENITDFADSIKKEYKEFEYSKFLKMILPNLEFCELKERSNLIEDALVSFLPEPFKKGVEVLLKVMPQKIIATDNFGFGGFIFMPQTGYVVRCGMDDFDLSMHALYEMTRRSTAEFHIRFFILKHYEKTMKKLEEWSYDDCPHVRRLVSEGTRPRLPWAFVLKKFVDNPIPVIKLLEKLKNDPELYVRRSVANNLNDISKDHADIVTSTLKEWENNTKEMAWLTKHALRTLLKKGNTEALALLGFTKSTKIDLEIRLKSSEVIFGDSLEFEVCINSKEDKTVPIMIDFIIHYKKANGSLSAKIFKLATKKIKKDETLNIQKKHKFADYTTRKHYAGEHKISAIINGKVFKEYSFLLIFK